MTKKISVSLEDGVYQFLKDEHYNISAFINALVRKKMVALEYKNPTNISNAEKEFNEVLNEEIQ